MEKKKMKLWKKILIVVLIIVAIIIINLVRKTIILADLDQKVSDYENNSTNIHIKTIYNFIDYYSEIERFIKNDVEKLIVQRTEPNGNQTKITQITYPNERKLYTETADTKVMYTYEEEAPKRGYHIEESVPSSYASIMNFAYSTNLAERIMNAFVTKISSVRVNGKECYELSSLHNSNFIYLENTKEMSVYVEKETGLPVAVIEKIIEDGTEKQNTTTYAIEFGTVIDEDIAEPNSAEYVIGD